MPFRRGLPVRSAFYVHADGIPVAPPDEIGTLIGAVTSGTGTPGWRVQYHRGAFWVAEKDLRPATAPRNLLIWAETTLSGEELRELLASVHDALAARGVLLRAAYEGVADARITGQIEQIVEAGREIHDLRASGGTRRQSRKGSGLR